MTSLCFRMERSCWQREKFQVKRGNGLPSGETVKLHHAADVWRTSFLLLLLQFSDSAGIHNDVRNGQMFAHERCSQHLSDHCFDQDDHERIMAPETVLRFPSAPVCTSYPNIVVPVEGVESPVGKRLCFQSIHCSEWMDDGWMDSKFFSSRFGSQGTERGE